MFYFCTQTSNKMLVMRQIIIWSLSNPGFEPATFRSLSPTCQTNCATLLGSNEQRCHRFITSTHPTRVLKNSATFTRLSATHKGLKRLLYPNTFFTGASRGHSYHIALTVNIESTDLKTSELDHTPNSLLSGGSSRVGFPNKAPSQPHVPRASYRGDHSLEAEA
jgi:hypothetical protein